MRKLGTLLLSGFLSLGLAACGNSQNAADTSGRSDEGAATELEVVRIGLTGANNDQWEHVQSTLLEEGIDLQLVLFTDWVTPNTSLVDGSLELNNFQTYGFLDTFNEQNGQNLVPIGETMVMHFGVYSDSITDLADVPVGAQVTLPNDAANMGRALLLLQTAGLIEIDPAVGFLPTPGDITDNPLELTFIELEAQQLPRSIVDVDLTLMNASIAVDGGFNPERDAIFLEPLMENSPYLNIIVARYEDADNETFQTVVRHFQTAEVAAIIARMFDGSARAVFDY